MKQTTKKGPPVFKTDTDLRLSKSWNSLLTAILTYCFIVTASGGWFFENGMSPMDAIVATSSALMCGYIMLV